MTDKLFPALLAPRNRLHHLLGLFHPPRPRNTLCRRAAKCHAGHGPRRPGQLPGSPPRDHCHSYSHRPPLLIIVVRHLSQPSGKTFPSFSPISARHLAGASLVVVRRKAGGFLVFPCS